MTGFDHPQEALEQGWDRPFCNTCNDSGFYFRLLPHMNPFSSSIEVTARNMIKLICACKAGQEYERNPFGKNTARAPE